MIQHLRSLRPIFPGVDHVGPYGNVEVSMAARKLGRDFEDCHREMLMHFGGGFAFEDGPVNLGDSGLDVSRFLGLGEDDFNIVDWTQSYTGVIPRRWYAFAFDVEWSLYCISETGSAHHVTLEEPELTWERRAEQLMECVAPTFRTFIDLLALPDWASDTARGT